MRAYPYTISFKFWTKQGRHFNIFSWGAKIFFYFLMPPDYWKIGKNNTLYVVILTSFIVPFFFFLFFLFFLFFFVFFFFSFSLGGGRRPPSPPKWRLWFNKARLWGHSYIKLNVKCKCCKFIKQFNIARLIRWASPCKEETFKILLHNKLWTSD